MPRIDGVTNIYIGIDPGASGGLASIGESPVLTMSMPPTERDIWNWIHGHGPYEDDRTEVFAVIEKVSGYIGEAHPGSAMFKFGMSYGGLRMALVAAGIPFDEVTPQRWQKALGITPRRKHDKKRQVQIKRGKNKGKWKEQWYGGETDSDFKNRLRQKAQQLFPSEHVTLATADALLIAEYCRRKQGGKL